MITYLYILRSWLLKKTYLFLLNNTLIPSWRVAFNPRRKLVIKSMKPIFRAKNSIADWGRTGIVRWLGFLSNIGIPNVKWNNKKITAKFILLYLIPWTNWFEWKMIFRERDFILHFGPARPWHRPDNMPAQIGLKYEKVQSREAALFVSKAKTNHFVKFFQTD